METSVYNISTSVNNITFYVGEIISEQTEQSQIFIPSETEKFEYVGMDEDEAITLVSCQQIEIFEEAQEPLSDPSSLQLNEEVQQNANIVINPCFESMQKEHTIADVAESLQQICVENLQVVLKKECDDQSKGSENSLRGEILPNLCHRSLVP